MSLKLGIDIGNTNIVFGIWDCDEKKILFKWRVYCNKNMTSDEFGIGLINYLSYLGVKINFINISCVVKELFFIVKEAIIKYFGIEPVIINSDLKLGLDFSALENPKELGADRICDCLAGYRFYSENRFDLIIIDFGTATTYDLIDRTGRFITGITAPGIKLSAESLFEKASLLEKIEIYEPKDILVKNTGDSLRAGIIYSQMGACRFIIDKLKSYCGENKVIITGGLCDLIKISEIDIKDYDLTLKGLMLV